MAGAADVGLLFTKSAARCSRRESQLCVIAGRRRLLANMSRLLIQVLMVGSLGDDKIETAIYSVTPRNCTDSSMPVDLDHQHRRVSLPAIPSWYQ